MKLIEFIMKALNRFCEYFDPIHILALYFAFKLFFVRIFRFLYLIN